MAVTGVLRNYMRLKVGNTWVKNPVPIGARGIRPMVVGNWKMNPTNQVAFGGNSIVTSRLIDECFKATQEVADVEIVIAPPFPYFHAFNFYKVCQEASPIGDRKNMHLGAQNVFPRESGAFTGEVSPLQLKAEGVSHVIIGHSERRDRFGGKERIVDRVKAELEVALKRKSTARALETTLKYVEAALRANLGETDYEANQKALAALNAGLSPILCVGETLAEREARKMEKVVERQIREGLAGLSPANMADTVVAYEPVWAIGTGKTATPEQADAAHAFIREIVHSIHGPEIAVSLRILHGGSVKPDNIDGLMAMPNIDGALVGGASLDPAAFARIVKFGLEG